MRKSIDLNNSIINWKAFKTGGGHHGTLKFKSGEIEITENVPSGGEFVFDMNSIYDIDQIGILKTKLIEDLESERFFDTKQYPDSSFKITSVDHVADDKGYYAVSGNLTIKGVTNEIAFKAEFSISDNDVFNIQTAVIGVDRTKWGITFGAKGFLKKLESHIIANVFDVTANVVTQ